MRFWDRHEGIVIDECVVMEGVRDKRFDGVPALGRPHHSRRSYYDSPDMRSCVCTPEGWRPCR